MRQIPTLLLAGMALTSGVASAAPQTTGSLPPPTTPSQKSALLQMQEAFTSIAQTVEPTVVNIKSERIRPSEGEGGSGQPVRPGQTPRRLRATGSGVIVRADGYILTNDHVVEGASGGVVTVTLADGREFSGKVFPDFSSDLAVVKIDSGPTPLPTAGFADDTKVRPGQWAIAVGSPFDLQNTVTVGIISAVGRHQSIGAESSSRYYPDLIQTDAAINPGNSGGPLFNMDGKVVGINVAIESPVDASAGVGFAIPSDIAQSVMNALIQSGHVTRGYLGIAPEDLTPALQAEYSQKTGALVRDVKVDSPAGRAGLQAGDIVTAFGGKAISGEVSLREAISAAQPGAAVRVGYVRDDRRGTASVTVGTSPVLPASVAHPSHTGKAPAALGLTVRSVTASDRVTLGLSPSTRGVVITAVASGSPAERAGEAASLPLLGTVIQKVGHRPVTTRSEYELAVAAPAQLAASGTHLVLLYAAGGQVHQTLLSIP